LLGILGQYGVIRLQFWALNSTKGTIFLLNSILFLLK